MTSKSRQKKVNSPAAPPELLQAISSNKCGLFVGAGLSAAAGYPSWIVLLKNLIQQACQSAYINRRKSNELMKLLNDSDKILLIAEELREIYGSDVFQRELVKIFEHNISPTQTHLKIMDIPFKFLLTTNYDLLLERAYLKKHNDMPPAFTNMQPPEISEALWRDDYFILKAHGDVKNRASFVLTEHDYREIIHRSHGYRSAMSSIFTTNTILFLGVSFADPELRLLLGYLHDAFHGGRMHYALVPSTEFSKTLVNRWRKDFNIECICYKPTKGHPEVHEFVKSLAKVTSQGS